MSALRFGIPFTSTYTNKNPIESTVMSVARCTKINIMNDPGLFLYSAHFSDHVLLFIASMLFTSTMDEGSSSGAVFFVLIIVFFVLSSPHATTVFIPSTLSAIYATVFLFMMENRRLIMSMNTNSTTPVAIRACLCRSVAYPISITIFVVSVLTPLSIPSGIWT